MCPLVNLLCHRLWTKTVEYFNSLILLHYNTETTESICEDRHTEKRANLEVAY